MARCAASRGSELRSEGSRVPGCPVVDAPGPHRCGGWGLLHPCARLHALAVLILPRICRRAEQVGMGSCDVGGFACVCTDACTAQCSACGLHFAAQHVPACHCVYAIRSMPCLMYFDIACRFSTPRSVHLQCISSGFAVQHHIVRPSVQHFCPVLSPPRPTHAPIACRACPLCGPQSVEHTQCAPPHTALLCAGR